MPTVTGELTDINGGALAGLRPRMWWRLNRPALHGGQFITAHRREAQVTGRRFAAQLEQTFSGEFYSVEVEYFDPEGKRATVFEVWPQRIPVDEKGGELGSLPGAVLAPDSTWVGLEEPTPEYSWWLKATVGDPDTGVLTGPGDLFRNA